MSAQGIISLLTTGWSFEPTVLVGVLVACVLYGRGVTWSLRRGYRHSLEWWRITLFYLAALSFVLALESPIDAWADTYFWTHMLQHATLIFVTAPLALLSAPWMPLWRGFPLNWRRAFLRRLARNPGVFPALRRIAHVVGSPVFAWLFYVVDLTFWHIPALYDLTEANSAIHYTEHVLFLVSALLFWGQLIPSFPFKPRLGYAGQVIYLFAATLHGNLLDWALMSATTPSYGYYAALPRTPDMISAVVDEHVAAGIMMTVSLFAFVTLLTIIVGLWLVEDERRTEAATQALLQRQ